MKKVLISVLTILLCAVIALSLVACGEKEAEIKGPAEDVSIYHSGDGYETVNDPLTWDKINAFDVVHDGMTIEEGKDLVVDFFRFAKTTVWIPNETYEYKIKETSSSFQTMEGSAKYGGLPYVSWGCGSVYRLMDYMDQETHVANVTQAGKQSTLFGNQCSFGSYVGVGRVINSAQYALTKNMTVKAGFVKVGDYIYDDDVDTYREGIYNTVTILDENSEEKMYECYAGLKKGDVIVYYTTAGHVVLMSEDAHVVRDASGKVDPIQSYVTVIDQTSTHSTMTNAAGDTFAYEANVDAKWTFQKMFKGEYIPFTFKEWLGEDPIESSWAKYSYTGDSIALSDIYKAKVTSNYAISDIYVSVYNAKGIEVYKMATRAESPSTMELGFSRPGTTTSEIWGTEENIYADQEYTVKVYAQLYTGERPTLWEGKLVQE
ncbi:MAG: hypothetical protein IJZ56_03675 [Oscillospiraceae bacterium]|nr:hypothetical protein [Oscillospiraceae bacterium]